jgi:hypothetical protein
VAAGSLGRTGEGEEAQSVVTQQKGQAFNSLSVCEREACGNSGHPLDSFLHDEACLTEQFVTCTIRIRREMRSDMEAWANCWMHTS